MRIGAAVLGEGLFDGLRVFVERILLVWVWAIIWQDFGMRVLGLRGIRGVAWVCLNFKLD